MDSKMKVINDIKIADRYASSIRYDLDEAVSRLETSELTYKDQIVKTREKLESAAAKSRDINLIINNIIDANFI